MPKEKIRVRFAPSPTGYLHIGGARTALFNWLFAKKMHGEFIVRIEDTDTERLKKDSVEGILKSLAWLGLDYAEGPEKSGSRGPYFQSERTEIYRRYADQLLKLGAAYYCFCTPEELAEQREEQKRAKKPFRYAKTCRELKLSEIEKKLQAGLKPVLRIKTPNQGTLEINDLIHGLVKFPLAELDDFIIMKSNNTPTYNFACVVDDYEMEISHVLRAEEHLSNTPKQILLYQALQLKAPFFGHLPMILAPDRSKLSKRHGATSVEEFRAAGYLSEALINYLSLLGWAPGSEEEIFSREQTIAEFSLSKVVKKAAIYDVKKLTWLNGQYLSHLPLEKIMPAALEFLLENKLLSEEDLKQDMLYLEKLVALLRVRVKTLQELAEAAVPFLGELPAYDSKGVEKYFQPRSALYLQKCAETIASLPEFTELNLEELYNSLAADFEVKLGDLIHPCRLALTGKTVSPGLFEVMVLLGKEKTLERLILASQFIKTLEKEKPAG